MLKINHNFHLPVPHQLHSTSHLELSPVRSEGDVAARVAARDGAIVRVESRSSDELATGRSYDLAALVHEQSISTNTAAAGGNAQLMTMA